MRFEFSPAAETDLEQIFDYTRENWSLAQAFAYTDLLQSGVKAVAEGLAHSWTIPERPGIFQAQVKSHYLIFTKVAGVLQVRRILHVSMDTLAHI